jgi:anti-sigma factor RsiW
MDCQGFEDRIDAFEAGRLSSEEREAAEKHLKGCAQCRALVAIVRGESDMLAPKQSHDLALSILQHTSGPVCPSAEQLLCDWVDGTLGVDDQEILAPHMAHCPDCSALAAVLTELKEALPNMATLEPDTYFTADVLQATVGRHSRARGVRGLVRIRQWWDSLILRPRIAWETAYVGALLLMLILGNPGMLLQHAPRAVAVPEVLIQSSSQMLQNTTATLVEKQRAAEDSLSTLRLQGKSLLDAAEKLRNQTTSSLRERVTAFVNELKSDWLDGNQKQNPEGNLR